MFIGLAATTVINDPDGSSDGVFLHWMIWDVMGCATLAGIRYELDESPVQLLFEDTVIYL